MSLLRQNSSEELDDAALGEELTKGTSHVVWASIIAAMLVSVIIAVYFIAWHEVPPATGEIVQVWVHPRHIETPGIDANGAPMPTEVFDQVLVFTQVRLHNQSKHPLSLQNILTNVTIEDGVHSSYAATTSDYERVFQAYPELASLHGKSLSPETIIAPGQTLEGMIVSAFRMTKQQWDARKELNYSFTFRYQPKLVLAPRSAVIYQ
jgi:hypothetical protein